MEATIQQQAKNEIVRNLESVFVVRLVHFTQAELILGLTLRLGATDAAVHAVLCAIVQEYCEPPYSYYAETGPYRFVLGVNC